MDELIKLDFEKEKLELGLNDDTVVFIKNFNGYWPIKEDKKEKKDSKPKKENNEP